ncbi:MAG: pimeloyl-ACP methyl ester esterase BioH [Proteobacteria bacterium]|nr:pimeloyl-ACP methyl ester esterase BioH [Pseudomonadota bacterium]
MHIETVGTGPDLVLIHGWAMHGGIFAPLTPLLAGHFRVHVVDLPGHGFSHDDDAPVDARAWAARIADATPRGAIWVGWSMGGLIVLHAALDAPDHVRGLVEIANSPRFVAAADWPHAMAPKVLEGFEAGLEHNYRATVEGFLALELIGSPHPQSMLRDLKARVFERGEPSLRVLVEGLRVLEATDLRARLAELAMPNLWIAGHRDRLIHAAAMRWAAQQTTHGEFIEIDSGHAPFLSHPREVADAIVEFAGRVPRA